MQAWNPTQYAISMQRQRPVASLKRRGYDDGRETLDSDGTYEIQRAGYNTSVPNYTFYQDLDGPAENYYDAESAPYVVAYRSRNGNSEDEDEDEDDSTTSSSDKEEDEDEEDDEEQEEEEVRVRPHRRKSPAPPQAVPMSWGGGSNFPSSIQPAFNLTAYDPGARQLRQVSQTGKAANSYVQQAPQNVLDIQTNPVQFLDTRLPMPTIGSPVRSLGYNTLYGGADPVRGGGGGVDGGVGGGADLGFGSRDDGVQEDNLCCTLDIPSKELRQVREDLGQSIADKSRWGLGPGEGVSASLTVAPESGTQFNYGPVPVSSPIYTNKLYDQGFISMSAVPMLDAGKYKDPLTGVWYQAYESALPPPDADYEETLNNPARNVKLAHLQGGWTDNTPRPTKTEVVEDDFHFQYDRTINTYGTYDSSRYVERFERNNRFKRDDEHPDPDGPDNNDQVPANFVGNQYQKIRPLPYMPPTNRGKWAETTFRSGVDANVAVGNNQQLVAQTFTTFPCVRAENTRMDGGGMEVTVNTTAQMDTQMGLGRRDLMPTQRSTTEQNMPPMGPAQHVRLASNIGVETYEPPTGFNGTEMMDVFNGGVVQQGAGGTNGGNGQFRGTETYEAPTGFNGTEMMDVFNGGVVQQGAGGTNGGNGQFRGTETYEPPTGFNGTELIDVLMGGAGAAQMQLAGGSGGAGGGWSAAGSAVMASVNQQGAVRFDMTGRGQQGTGQWGSAIQVEAPVGFNGTYVVDVAQMSAVQPTNVYATSTTTSTNARVTKQNTKNERFRQDAYGATGGHDGQNLVTSQAVTKQNTKNERFRQDAYGATGGHDGQNMLTSQLVTSQNTKNERFRQDAYGAGGADFAFGQQDVAAVRAKISTKREEFLDFQTGADTSLNHNTAPAAVAMRTRFSTKKGALTDFLMPSSAVGGTESTLGGSQNVGMSTNLTTKRERLYDTQFGFSPEQVHYNDLVLGHYQQTMEHQNIRGYGNLEHPVAGAGYAFFMTQRECEN